MTVSAVVFDLGGVITESPMTAFAAYDAGLPLALLSNNVAPVERTGRLGELLALFDAVVESSTEGLRRPEPEIYRRALTRLSDAAGGETTSSPADACALSAERTQSTSVVGDAP